MIENIKELVIFLEKDGRRKANNARFKSITGVKKHLYDAIVQNHESSEAELHDLISPEVTNRSFRKTQERLYNDLVDVVISINDTGGSSTSQQKLRQRCIKKAAVIKVLLFNGLSVNVRNQSKKLINTCLKHEMYDIAGDVLFANLDLYGRGYQDKKMFYRYLKLYKRVTQINIIEQEVQWKYFRLFVDFSTTQPEKDEKLRNQLEEDQIFFEKTLKGDYSTKCNIVCYSALTTVHELFKNYKELVKTSDKALAFLEGRTQNNALLQSSFLLKRFRAHISLNDQVKIKEDVQALEMHSVRHSFSYYMAGTYRALMEIHSQNYKEALDTLLSIQDNYFEKNAPKAIQEYSNVIYAYLAFLSEAGIFQSEHFEKNKFRVFRFLNDVPRFSHDKQGVNISILVLHILFLLNRKKHSQIIDRIDSLSLYSYRYLKNDKTFRSNCFVKMLIAMTKADFHPVATERKIGDLREKLGNRPLELAEQPVEVEIVPYEVLWEIVVEILEKG